MRRVTILLLLTAGCFHDAIDVDPIVGTGGGTGSGSGDGPPPGSSDSGPSTDSTSTGQGSFSGTGGDSTGGDSTGGDSTGGGSTGDDAPASTIAPCDANCPTCLDVGMYSACATACPCGEGFECTDPPAGGYELCFLPCTTDMDCFEGTVCVQAAHPLYGTLEACLWPE